MEAGRELDEAVAKMLLNLRLLSDVVTPTEDPSDYIANHRKIVNVRPYSTDIAAAWEVVDKLKSRAELIQIIFYPLDGTWQCSLRNVVENAKTAPHAICLAALKAIESIK